MVVEVFAQGGRTFSVKQCFFVGWREGGRRRNKSRNHCQGLSKKIFWHIDSFKNLANNAFRKKKNQVFFNIFEYVRDICRPPPFPTLCHYSENVSKVVARRHQGIDQGIRLLLSPIPLLLLLRRHARQ